MELFILFFSADNTGGGQKACPLTSLFCVAKRNKKEKKKKFESRRLSPRSKDYYFSHSRASRIQTFFRIPWFLHPGIHFAGPVSITGVHFISS